MEDENIIWKEMSTVPFPKEQKEQISIEPCKMDAYTSLYAELKDKCNPQRFMLPYDKEKVDIANELYQQLLNTPRGEETSVHHLRDKAIQKLGITISTKRLYKKLLDYCNPERFMDPYDFVTVKIANHYYPLVEKYKNDVYELEKLNDEILQNKEMKIYYQEIKNSELVKSEREKIGIILFFAALIIPIVVLLLFSLFAH